MHVNSFVRTSNSAGFGKIVIGEKFFFRAERCFSRTENPFSPMANCCYLFIKLDLRQFAAPLNYWFRMPV